MEETVLAVGKENSALEEKLVRSTTEIQSLKQELEFAKVKLKDISEQICNLRMNSTQSKNRNDESVKEKVAVETVDIDCQTHIESNEASLQTTKNDVFNKSSQTTENAIKEEASQTSFTEETDDYEIILDRLTKLMVKYDDIKTQYKENCLVGN